MVADKRGLILLFLLSTPLIQAIGVTPSSESINFKPNLNTEFYFTFFPTNDNNDSTITLSGDLANYASIDKEEISGKSTVNVKISLPQSLPSGVHFVNVRKKKKSISETGISASSGITAPIRIFVPYEGRYIEASLEMPSLNTNEEGTIKINVKNIGSEAIQSLYAKILILNNEEIVKTLETEKTILPVEASKTLTSKFSTYSLKEGEYKAKATIFFDSQEETIEKEFTIGDLIVSITNYTSILTEHKINKFYITLESKWNNRIEEVFTGIAISQDSNQLLNTITSTTYLEPRGIKQLETFLDLTDISAGEYDIEFILNYAGRQSTAKGKLDVTKKGIEFSPTLIAAITVIIILILLILWYIIIKKKNSIPNYEKKS